LIAEQLVRSGQAFVEGVGSASILLQVISDSIDEAVRNHWQRVIIVEIDPAEEQVEVQPIQSWGNWHALEGRRKQLFFPDHRAAFAPVFMPKGGNPLAPQGHYGPPVYPVWERHWRCFADSADGVHRFLEPRLERTIGVDLSKRMRRQIYQAVHEAIRGYEPEGKPLAVLILAVREEGNDFSFSIEGGGDGQIAKSSLYPERFLCVNAEMMLQHVWEAKEKEGVEKGRLEHGVCAFTGKRGVVISGDNKTWPWFTTTWEAPFPETFKETDHVKRMAFSP
jgi:hypothetical protein